MLTEGDEASMSWHRDLRDVYGRARGRAWGGQSGKRRIEAGRRRHRLAKRSIRQG